MKLLIIGGTYFLGKAFLELCDEGKNEITVLNRGTRRLSNNEDGHVREIHADRHKEEELEAVLDQFDKTESTALAGFTGKERNELEDYLIRIENNLKQSEGLL